MTCPIANEIQLFLQSRYQDLNLGQWGINNALLEIGNKLGVSQQNTESSMNYWYKSNKTKITINKYMSFGLILCFTPLYRILDLE